MRPAPAKTRNCHMAGSNHTTSLPKMACSCSLSSGDSSLNLTAHSDFRFDSPRAAQTTVHEVSHRLPKGAKSPILAAFTSPPDQPPEILS